MVASSKPWDKAEFSQALSTALIQRKLGFNSVNRELTRYLLGCLGYSVSLQEVFVAGSATQPGLTKVDPTCEKEAARSWFNTTLQQSPDLTLAAQATVAGEQSILLTKHPGSADLDHCCS